MIRGLLGYKHITKKEFTMFRDIIYKESGICLTEKKMALLQARLAKRLRSLDLPNFKKYYTFLQNNYNEEIVNLINCITTNKTNFFREENHFKFMRDVILPDIVNRKQEKIRIWSAGCSSGQEAYSIAMTIIDFYEGINNPLPDSKILATDIDTNALAIAKEGIYNKDEFKGLERDNLKKYFLKGKGSHSGYLMTKDSLKEIVYFRRLNLLDEKYPMKGRFDIIFCRNVIIYFDDNARSKLVNNFHTYLNDKGYLFTGHAENLRSFADKFKLVDHTIYIKSK